MTLYGELVAVREEGRTGGGTGGSPVFEIVLSDILLNLPPHPKPPVERASSPLSSGQKPEPLKLEVIDITAAADFLKSTYQFECRARCQKEREHYAHVVREYLERSFDARIKKAQERAMLLAAEVNTKPEFKLAAEEARGSVEDLQRSREERRAGLKRLEIARTGPVQHLGTAVVLVPDADVAVQLAALADELDPQVRLKSERAAEEFVVAHLIQEGFPEDRIERVGPLKIGFDIRAHRVRDEATGEMEVKRIEVKGRVRGQPVRLTTNEWYKAQQLAETYWLYVVWDPLGKEPDLVRIQNPAAKLDHAKREIVASRFFEIPAEAVLAVAESIRIHGKGLL